jgi:hypothetical protein
MTTARQRFGKNIPEATLSTTEVHPLLGNEQINILKESVIYVVRPKTLC